MRFVGTSILLYAISSDPSEAAKAERALALLNERDLALSVQVLQESYVQATRPAAPVPVSHEAAAALIGTLLRFPVQEMTVPLLHAALAVRQRWQLSYWDAGPAPALVAPATAAPVAPATQPPSPAVMYCTTRAAGARISGGRIASGDSTVKRTGCPSATDGRAIGRNAPSSLLSGAQPFST